jgi:hypothetical protein
MVVKEKLRVRHMATIKNYIVVYKEVHKSYVFQVRVRQEGDKNDVGLTRRMCYSGDCKEKLQRKKEIYIRNEIISYFKSDK